MATYYTNEIVKKTYADSYTESDEHFIITDKVLVDREERESEREYKELKIKSQKGAMSKLFSCDGCYSLSSSVWH